jgi:hypothetical protein
MVAVAIAGALSLLLGPTARAGHVVDGVDVKVTDDNNNVDGGVDNVTPSKDAQNRQSNEPTISISPVASPVTGLVGDVIAASANDYRMVPHVADVWTSVYLSLDGGTTWFGAPPFPNGYNTMVPGFPTDTSPEGQASPLLGLDASGDPVIRFDADGNLYIASIGFNRDRDQADKSLDTVVYVSRYDYTPGTPATASTTSTAGLPPHFTYVRTTLVAKGAVGFAVPSPFGFAGRFVDKDWMEMDLNSPADSPCAGSVYVAWTAFHGLSGSSPLEIARSTDGGATFSPKKTISTGGQDGSTRTQGADIAVASDGTVYVGWHSDPPGNKPESIQVVRSTDCGKHWSQPVIASEVVSGQPEDVAFRVPTFAFLATDTSDPDLVYVAYQSLGDDFDVFAQRSTDGGATWGTAVQLNDDAGDAHQVFPTIEVSNGALHAAWYDSRNSVTEDNEALDVYYACSNCDGYAWPVISHNERVTDVSHNPNCQMFGGGTVAFHGDYIELDAYWNGANHVVHVAWADNRDVPPSQCDLDPAPGTSNSIGNRNQNIYTDTLIVAP